jgi:O-antigen/teichoic acid export membrane protein
VGIVYAFVKVRVGYAATAFGASALRTDARKAAGTFQLAWLVDVLTGVAGFLIIVGLAVFVGTDLTSGAEPGVIVLAGLILLAACAEDTCSSILFLFDRFRLLAAYSATIEVVRVALVLLALVVYESLVAVLVAIVVTRLARAAVSTLLAVRVFDQRCSGARLTNPQLRHVPRDERNPMLTMMFHTNFITYGRAAESHLPTLLLGGLAGLTETGIYKVGTAAAAALGKIIDPASAALLPRLAKYWAAGHVRHVRRLIRNTSLISVPSMLILVAVMVVFQEPILELVGGEEAARHAGGVLILAGIGQALYGAVFWHTTLLFTARRAGMVSITVLSAAAIQLGLLLLLVPTQGAMGAAIALLVGRLIANGTQTAVALLTLRREERKAHGPAPRLPTDLVPVRQSPDPAETQDSAFVVR